MIRIKAVPKRYRQDSIENCTIDLINIDNDIVKGSEELEIEFNKFMKECDKGDVDYSLKTNLFRQVVGIKTGNMDLSIDILNRVLKNISLARNYGHVYIGKGNNFNDDLTGLFTKSIDAWCPCCQEIRTHSIKFKTNDTVTVTCLTGSSSQCGIGQMYKVVVE